MIVMTIINGEEHRSKKDISFGRDIYTQKDTVIINFPCMIPTLKQFMRDGVMEGDWIVNFRITMPYHSKLNMEIVKDLISSERRNQRL